MTNFRYVFECYENLYKLYNPLFYLFSELQKNHLRPSVYLSHNLSYILYCTFFYYLIRIDKMCLVIPSRNTYFIVRSSLVLLTLTLYVLKTSLPKGLTILSFTFLGLPPCTNYRSSVSFLQLFRFLVCTFLFRIL